jgi:hypothetical protein
LVGSGVYELGVYELSMRRWRPACQPAGLLAAPNQKLKGETLSGFHYIIGLYLCKSRTIVAVKRASRKMLPFLASTASEEFAIIKIGAA